MIALGVLGRWWGRIIINWLAMEGTADGALCGQVGYRQLGQW